MDSEIRLRTTTVYFRLWNPTDYLKTSLLRQEMLPGCDVRSVAAPPGTWGQETGHQQFSDHAAVHSARILYVVSR